jgi:hypothetical protein
MTDPSVHLLEDCNPQYCGEKFDEMPNDFATLIIDPLFVAHA